ncbi:hypothetical protein [Komagataeibacter sp. SM21]|uniref:hypothetical protein n=1 Tax=Komagataeibacter sp. SM21 TaxID=3242899 RepID=UPI0035296C7F
MTASTNWPNLKQPGVPLFHERDGKHVIDVDPEGAGNELVYYWKAKHQVWVEYDYEGPDDALEGYDLTGWAYVGPFLTHAQIAELLAGERERCAKECDAIAIEAASTWKAAAYDSYNRAGEAAEETAEICAQKIRNLGATP